MFIFFCFFSFIPVSLSSLSLSFISSTISSISFLIFSGRRHKMTHKGWHVVIKKKKQKNNNNKTMLIQVIVATKWEQIQQLSRIFFFWKLTVIPYSILFIYLKALRSVRLNVCLYVLSVICIAYSYYCPSTSTTDKTVHYYPNTSPADTTQSTNVPVVVLLTCYSPLLYQYRFHWYDVVPFCPSTSPAVGDTFH